MAFSYGGPRALYGSVKVINAPLKEERMQEVQNGFEQYDKVIFRVIATYKDRLFVTFVDYANEFGVLYM